MENLISTLRGDHIVQRVRQLDYQLTRYSFVGTYMEREANDLIMENISKNMSDADE